MLRYDWDESLFHWQTQYVLLIRLETSQSSCFIDSNLIQKTFEFGENAGHSMRCPFLKPTFIPSSLHHVMVDQHTVFWIISRGLLLYYGTLVCFFFPSDIWYKHLQAFTPSGTHQGSTSSPPIIPVWEDKVFSFKDSTLASFIKFYLAVHQWMLDEYLALHIFCPFLLMWPFPNCTKICHMIFTSQLSNFKHWFAINVLNDCFSLLQLNLSFVPFTVRGNKYSGTFVFVI